MKLKETSQFSKVTWSLVIVILVILAALISVCAWKKTTFPGDLQLTILLQSIYSQPLLSSMKWISFLNGGWRAALLVIISSFIVWWRLGWLEGILIPVAGLTSLVHLALKAIVNRPRPASNLVQVLTLKKGGGFPSGHSFFAIVVWGLLAYFILANIRKRSLRILILIVFILLILLTGLSRVYLGVHWPSDVLGGYLSGGVFLAALIWFYQTWHRRLQPWG